MGGAPSDAEQLAKLIGSRPLLLLAGLVVVVVISILVMVTFVRWSERHARAMWSRAGQIWSTLGRERHVRMLEARFPLIWRMMRTLSATEYLVLHLALGFAITVSALGFFVLAEAVSGGEAIVKIDLALAGSLHEASTEAGIAMLGFLTDLGGGWAVFVIGIGVLLVLLWKRKLVLAVGWVIALSGAGILNHSLKAWFVRPRPTFPSPITVASGWSFPSGHAMGTFVTVGMATYLAFLFIRSPLHRVALVVAAASWTVVIGFSRMYLGVHYLSDVLAGFTAGTIWLSACISGVEVARRRPLRGGTARAHFGSP